MNKQEIGKAIAQHRAQNHISKYSLKGKNELTYPQMKAIEDGSKKYTIDSLLDYLQSVGMELIVKGKK